MELIVTRSMDPDAFELTIKMDQADFNKAFANQTDPDEDLFYALREPRVTFDERDIPTKIQLAASFAALVKAFDDAAAKSSNATLQRETKGKPA